MNGSSRFVIRPTKARKLNIFLFWLFYLFNIRTKRLTCNLFEWDLKKITPTDYSEGDVNALFFSTLKFDCQPQRKCSHLCQHSLCYNFYIILHPIVNQVKTLQMLKKAKSYSVSCTVFTGMWTSETDIRQEGLKVKEQTNTLQSTFFLDNKKGSAFNKWWEWSCFKKMGRMTFHLKSKIKSKAK